ncbi:hypothetical protein HET69_07790 [Streptomyces sp. CJ_13]|nr:hypothetical protein [Streptomyces sp. CJ_13]MBT1183919.1 hypothetical protein [Streptomyces sp. CJ_13]
MTATTLYEIESSEGDDGTTHPTEQLWTPGEDAVENGLRQQLRRQEQCS